jgi:hypothetical protein
MRRLPILVATVAAALLAALAVTATAGAAVPCRDRIFNDWYHDGRVASSYPTSCYRDALKHIPADARIYSSLASDIKSAMLASLSRQHGKPAPKEVGHGLRALDLVADRSKPVSPDGGTQQSRTSQGGTPSAAANVPVADASHGGGVPLPILVLGGLALMLAAAGAIGTGVKYARGRR